MRSPKLALILFCSGCASNQVVIRHEAGAFSVRDYLKPAYETLGEAETDTGGHRIRAQLETRAALEGLGESSLPTRAVPFEGPPSMAVARALLEHSVASLPPEGGPRVHTQRALNELRQAGERP